MTTERDILVVATLDQAVGLVDQAAATVGAEFILTEGEFDFRSGHVEVGGVAKLDIVIMREDAEITTIRVDSRRELGHRLADALESHRADASG